MNIQIKLNWKIYLFIYATSLMANSVLAQNISYDEIKHHFPHPEKGIWIDHYSGYNQFGELIYLSLAHDHHVLYGILKNKTKHQTFSIEGNYKKNKLSAIIADSSENRIGNLSGKIKDSVLTADLFIPHLAQTIVCKQMSRYSQDLPECPSKNYFSEYLSQDKNILMTIRKFDDGSLSGMMIHLKDSLGSWFYGSLTTEQWTTANVFMTDYNSIKRIKSILEYQNDSIVILSQNNNPAKISFSQTKKFEFKCKSEILLSLQANSRYPWPEDKSFRKWMQTELQNWNDKIYNYGIKSLSLYESYTLDFVPVWWSDQLISGNLRMDEPGENRTIDIPWHYSFRQNESFTLDDIFDKNTNYRTRISQRIESTKQKMTEGTKDKLYEFIISDPFENWCLLPIGLSFQSKWHPVYGEYRIIIPFKEINDLLRKNGPLKKVM
ncbi:MAG: hypothetical protein IPI50_05525 [Saprospiraceae bacterium]|nr:hypothetical protein [Saprospiraceae bacterium]